MKLILHGTEPVQETDTQIRNYSCIIQELFAYSKQAITLMKCQMIKSANERKEDKRDHETKSEKAEV